MSRFNKTKTINGAIATMSLSIQDMETIEKGVNWPCKGTKTVQETRKFANDLLKLCDWLESENLDK